MNINPLSVSFDSILNDLKLMIASQPDVFKDFFNDGSGAAVTDMAAALGAFYAYQILTQRRELTLEEAQNYSSLLGNARTKNYSAYRGHNVWVNLTLTPTSSGAINSWTIIGSYEDYDIVLLPREGEEQSVYEFIEDTPITVRVVIGNKLDSYITATSKLQVFAFEPDNVTEDLLVMKNSTIVPYSNNIKDLLNNNYVVVSNAYGSVDVFCLSDNYYSYSPGDAIGIVYIERNKLKYSELALENFFISIAECNSFDLIEDRQDIEEKNSIRINAPLRAETSSVVKARADFRKELQINNPTIKSVKDYDVTPGIIAICALKQKGADFTEYEYNKLDNSIANLKASGVCRLIYTKCKKKKLILNFDVTYSDASKMDAVINAINKYIEDNYAYVLECKIDLYDLENYIEQNISGVKVVAPSVVTPAWEASKSYEISDGCISTTFDNNTYYVDNIVYKSGSTEPDWTDTIIEDGDLLWAAWDGDPHGVVPWSADKGFVIGSLIVNELDASYHNQVFQCIGYVNKTGSTEPDWETTLATFIDNEIVWEKIASSETETEYDTDQYYLIGDEVKKTIDADNVIYLKVVNYAAKSGATEPDWSAIDSQHPTVSDGKLQWAKQVYPRTVIAVPFDTYFDISTNLS